MIKMFKIGEIKLKIKGLLGVSEPFQVGGSWRLTIPKKVVKDYELEKKYKKGDKPGEYAGFVFLDIEGIDNGFLIVPISELLGSSSFNNSLTKFIDTSSITEEELKILIERLSEQNDDT